MHRRIELENCDPSLAHALQTLFQDQVAVSDLRVMEDGHAGLTFGFSVLGPAGRRDLILKKAPEGVPRSGSTDIYRQAPLLRALSAAGFKAPNAPFASESGAALGAPFIIMERLPGRSVIVWDPAPESLAQFADPAVIWTEAARLMGALHAFDWRGALATWEKPTSLAAELERWGRLLRHMQDERSVSAANALRALLQDTMPGDGSVALIHGDLQPGNVLYAEGRAQGLIDWDLASIGPTGLDVGWLLMIGDPAGWSANWTPTTPPDPQRMLEVYSDAGGVAPDDVHWHRAFAYFRMAAITGLNVKLHRDGRRLDPIWENFAMSVPYMLRRAHSLIRG